MCMPIVHTVLYAQIRTRVAARSRCASLRSPRPPGLETGRTVPGGASRELRTPRFAFEPHNERMGVHLVTITPIRWRQGRLLLAAHRGLSTPRFAFEPNAEGWDAHIATIVIIVRRLQAQEPIDLVRFACKGCAKLGFAFTKIFKNRYLSNNSTGGTLMSMHDAFMDPPFRAVSSDVCSSMWI
eukprot:IDg9674t1